MKRKAVDKTLEQHFLKEMKATCQNSFESELKQQQKNLKCGIHHVGQLHVCTESFSHTVWVVVVVVV